jgi:hypothetical protein
MTSATARLRPLRDPGRLTEPATMSTCPTHYGRVPPVPVHPLESQGVGVGAGSVMDRLNSSRAFEAGGQAGLIGDSLRRRQRNPLHQIHQIRHNHQVNAHQVLIHQLDTELALECYEQHGET